MIDKMSEYHFEVTPYNYVLNNPMIYIDPYGLDTIKVDKIKPNDWRNFRSNSDVIALDNVVITASRGNSNNNSGIYLGVLSLGMGQAENTLFNKETWYSLRAMKSYSQSFHGNQYEWTKNISKYGSKTLKWAGRGLGAYSFYKINKDYKEQTLQYNGRPLSEQSMAIEHASNVFSTFGGPAGAGWGIGWEIGRTIAGDSSYRENFRPLLQDFLNIERDQYNQRDLRMRELINNLQLK